MADTGEKGPARSSLKLLEQPIRQPEYDIREGDDQRQANDLEPHEGQGELEQFVLPRNVEAGNGLHNPGQS